MEIIPSELGFFRLIGALSFATIFVIWGIQIVNAGFYYKQTGDMFPLLDATGGKLFMLDKSLIDSIHLLAQKEEFKENFPEFFSEQLTYLLKRVILLDLAIYFIVFFILFKFAMWLGGEKQWSPLYQLLMILVVVAVFGVMEVAYTFYLSGQFVYPLQGVWSAVKNADKIFEIDVPEIRIIGSNLSDIRKQAGLDLNNTNSTNVTSQQQIQLS